MQITAANIYNVYLPGTITIPSSLEIINITNSYPMIVSVVVNSLIEANEYQLGQLVRLTVPITYNMIQANGLVGRVLSNISNEITLDLDSTQFDLFVIPSSPVLTPASLAPSGARNLTLDNTTLRVPFQSLNNYGN